MHYQNLECYEKQPMQHEALQCKSLGTDLTDGLCNGEEGDGLAFGTCAGPCSRGGEADRLGSVTGAKACSRGGEAGGLGSEIWAGACSNAEGVDGLGSGAWAGDRWFVWGLFRQMRCICAVITANKCFNGARTFA